MSKVAYAMTIDLALNALGLHLSAGFLQNFIAGTVRQHVLSHDVLQPVSLPQTLHEPSGNVFLCLTWSKDISQMLCICVHAQCCNAKIYVKNIAVGNDSLGKIWVTWGVVS